MKKIIAILLSVLFLFTMTACKDKISTEGQNNTQSTTDSSNITNSSASNSSNTKVYNMNEVADSWAPGLTFKVIGAVFMSRQEAANAGAPKPSGKYLFVLLTVDNQSCDTFISSYSEVWLKYKGSTKIIQDLDAILYDYDDILWYSVTVAATLSCDFMLIFDVGETVELKDLQLVISEFTLINPQEVVIKLG
ncbi:MAG: hypothetical protein IJA76_03315 [Clostridia bacterium]|nr:hypothetical protein [Clostridia bacterium]MBQ6883841.1 hypothetical protein [Clostridia bacterium]